MQTRIKGNVAQYRYDSLRELGTYIRDTPRTWNLEHSQHHEPRMDWDLNAGYDGAVRMAREGWLEGAERAQRALEAFAPVRVEPDIRNDVYGFRPHVARFCAGAPDCMIRHDYSGEGGGSKVLTLIVSVNALAYVQAEPMANFGIAVAQYINQLEAQGTRVELMGVITDKIRGWRVTQAWTVKNADQPLDLAVVAFSIGHPAMFRRLGFALSERCAAPECSSYGSTVDAMVSDVINAPDGAVVLTGMAEADTYAKTPEAGLKYVEQRIEQLIKEQEL